MNSVAIRVQNIGKLYRVGQVVGYKTLRDSIMHLLGSPFRRSSNEMASNTKSGFIWALKNVSFEIRPGEIVGIIGSNGAGKSTLLKLLSRITTPTEGFAEIHGRVGPLLEVGAGFHPELTGRENIYLNGAVLGMKKPEIVRKFDDIVEFSGVSRFLDTPVKHYSSGMYVRLAFAVAAFLEQEILIIDEVLAVGDASFQKKCLGKMNEVAKGGRTVLFVSHNLTAIRALCPRTILLVNGEIGKDGPTTEVLQRYLEAQQSNPGRVSWSGLQRPGNSSFKLNTVNIKTPEGTTSPAIEMSKGGLIEIQFEVIEDSIQAGFSLQLYDEYGNILFGSLSNLEPNFYGKPLAKGQYVTECRIPGDLLNSGTFSVQIIGFSAQWSDSFLVDSVFSFSVIEDGVLRGDHHAEYAGALRPRLSWKTKHLEEYI